MTLEQQKAIALGKARRRRAEAEGKTKPVEATEVQAEIDPNEHWLTTMNRKLGGFRDAIKGPGREAMNTATFGLAPKVAGATRSLQEATVGRLLGRDVPLTGAYQQPLEEIKQYRQENPKMALAAGMAGGMANPAARAYGKWAAAGETIPRQVGRKRRGRASLGVEDPFATDSFRHFARELGRQFRAEKPRLTNWQVAEAVALVTVTVFPAWAKGSEFERLMTDRIAQLLRRSRP